MQTPATVKDLIRLGANVKVSGDHAPTSLKDFARLAVSHKVHLTVVDGRLCSPSTLKDIVRIAKGFITLEV